MSVWLSFRNQNGSINHWDKFRALDFWQLSGDRVPSQILGADFMVINFGLELFDVSARFWLHPRRRLENGKMQEIKFLPEKWPKSSILQKNFMSRRLSVEWKFPCNYREIDSGKAKMLTRQLNFRPSGWNCTRIL